ncbi:MAG: hypothetical protein KDD84_15465, partial [Caldilineaceae bacterium]|nr:hypothetical protein [Caldilineaceae bacterium]
STTLIRRGAVFFNNTANTENYTLYILMRSRSEENTDQSRKIRVSANLCPQLSSAVAQQDA